MNCSQESVVRKIPIYLTIIDSGSDEGTQVGVIMPLAKGERELFEDDS
jgi:hypothetical protein